jgi:hypothetical protein
MRMDVIQQHGFRTEKKVSRKVSVRWKWTWDSIGESKGRNSGRACDFREARHQPTSKCLPRQACMQKPVYWLKMKRFP